MQDIERPAGSLFGPGFPFAATPARRRPCREGESGNGAGEVVPCLRHERALCGLRPFFDQETVGQGWISINGSGKVRWRRLSCIERTGAVHVHPSRNQEVSLRGANAVGKWPAPEVGLVEGLTVEMMDGRVCTMVAG